MADIFTKTKRSEMMAAVKGRGSKIEKAVAGFLRRNRIRYRSHVRSLPSNPDFYLPDHRTAVFVDSCFWHGCRYHGSTPKSNGSFWRKKIARNKERDREVNREYRKMGWRIVRVWEHVLKRPDADRKLGSAIRAATKDGKMST